VTGYYGRPVIKEPVWTPEIPWYLFAGGLGGGSAGLAWLAGLRGNEVLARRAWAAALASMTVSPVLLISDLGMPSRFLHMLRMFKVTSPMSVGSWVLMAAGGATGAAALDALLPAGAGGAAPRRRVSPLRGGAPGFFAPARGGAQTRFAPRRAASPRFSSARRALALAATPARPAAALMGLPLSTYTGALLAQTAVPVWHEARRELPALFGAGAAASAGAAATILTPCAFAGPARRLAVIGSAAELAVVPLMEHRLRELAEPYHRGAAGAYGQFARGLTVAGSLLIASRGSRSRAAAVAGGALVLAGAACERWSVFKAGFASARDPKYTIDPQRDRVTSGRARGGSRRSTAQGGPPAPAPADAAF